MIKAQLRDYIERVVAAKTIDARDVRDLQRDVVADGLTSRLEAEALLALDRSLPSDESWGDALVALMVDFVVWGSRPTGRVPAETAAWLITAFTCGEPTGTALQIARAIVAAAQEVDPDLLLFVHRGTSASVSLAA